MSISVRLSQILAWLKFLHAAYDAAATDVNAAVAHDSVLSDDNS